MSKGSILIDKRRRQMSRVSYASRKSGRRLYRRAGFRRSGRCENGVLTVMCGGGKSHFKKAQPVIDCFAQQVTLIGGPGSGQLTKMVNQICIAGLVQGLSEGVNFGLKAGLDMDKVIDTISKGAAGAWQMVNRAETMCKGEFEFSLLLIGCVRI